MRCVLRAQCGEDHAGGLPEHVGTHTLCCGSCNAAAQASGLEFEQILKDKLAQLGCDIYDGAFFDEVCAIWRRGRAPPFSSLHPPSERVQVAPLLAARPSHALRRCT